MTIELEEVTRAVPDRSCALWRCSAAGVAIVAFCVSKRLKPDK